ncbi:MAG: hypothetical protein QM804_06410 [Propionicimonas sp.]
MIRERTVVKVVGSLALVEFTSGVLQGYYVPLFSDIARYLAIRDADVNWFEGTQSALSALAIPIFAKLGDTLGYKRMLLCGTVLTAELRSLCRLPIPSGLSWWHGLCRASMSSGCR